MDNKLQILTFIFSFSYGIVYFYLVKLNRYLIHDNKTIIKYLDSSLFTLDSVLIYVIINYKINNGYFHIYFIITLVLGFFLAYYTQNSVKSTLNKLKWKK